MNLRPVFRSYLVSTTALYSGSFGSLGPIIVDTSAADLIAKVSGILPEDEAALDTQTHITNLIGSNVTLIPGGVDFGESSQIQIRNVGPFTGEFWGYTEANMTSASGAAGMRLLSPTYAPNGVRSRGGPQTWKFPAANGNVIISYYTGGIREEILERIQLVDMASTLAQPWDIYLAMGQSNMAATTVALDIDADKDGWSDKRLLAWPGSSNDLYGQVRDEVTALHAPLQSGPSTTAAADIGYTHGVSPAIAFGKRILADTDPSRNVCVVGASWSGVNLTQSDSGWKHDSSDPFAYDWAVARAQACLAAAPAGSVIKGVIWGQGEGDVNYMDLYPAAFADLKSNFETDIGSGPIPWVICNGLPDGASSKQGEYLQTMREMDANSGHANSQPLVYTVERDDGHVTDGTHSDAEGNRIVGVRAAVRMAEVN